MVYETSKPTFTRKKADLLDSNIIPLNVLDFKCSEKIYHPVFLSQSYPSMLGGPLEIYYYLGLRTLVFHCN